MESLRNVFFNSASSLRNSLGGKVRGVITGAGLKRATDNFMTGDSSQSNVGEDKEKQFSCFRAEGDSSKWMENEL